MSRSSQARQALSRDELRVVSLAADGYRPCDIANRMSTTVYRVNDHIYQVIVKLRIQSLEEAIALYCKRSPSQ